jgi:hypothetical protein
MKIEQLKSNIIVRGTIFPEPVQVIVTVPMGDKEPMRLGWEPLVKIEHYHVTAKSILATEKNE